MTQGHHQSVEGELTVCASAMISSHESRFISSVIFVIAIVGFRPKNSVMNTSFDV